MREAAGSHLQMVDDTRQAHTLFCGPGSPRASELMKAFGVKMIVEIFALHGIYVSL